MAQRVFGLHSPFGFEVWDGLLSRPNKCCYVRMRSADECHEPSEPLAFDIDSRRSGEEATQIVRMESRTGR